MNLIQVGREVRKIMECLSRTQMEPEEAKLAKEYSDLCALTNQRLFQCASMIEAGDAHQALQLAEVRPALLDLVTILAFKQVDEWRTRCRTHQLAVPEPLDAKAIKTLNAAYGKGIAANDPLYKEYREAMVRNNDAKAMDVLRMIVRLNPGDSNAKVELRRMEERDLKSRLQRLDASIAAADQKAVLEQIQEIESLGAAFPTQDQTWRRAQGVRCQMLFRQLQELRRQELWPESLAQLGLIRELCQEFTIELDEHSEREMSGIEQWARQQARNQSDEESFDRILRELGFLLEADQVGPLSKLPMEDLTQKVEVLSNKRRELDQFAQTVPPDLEKRFLQTLQDLRVHIHKQKARKTRLFRLGLGAAAAILILAALFGFEWRRETNLATVLQNLVESRQIAGIQRLLPSGGLPLALSPRLAAALKATQALLEQTRHAADECAREVSKLNDSSDDAMAGPESEQIFRRHAELLQQIKGLPTGAQADPRLNLSTFENRWNAFLAHEAPRRAVLFEQLLAEAENNAQNAADAPLSNEPSAEEQKTMEITSKLDALVQTPIPALKIESATSEKYQAFREEWDTWHSTSAALRAPDSLAEYLNSLRRLQACRYFDANLKPAAAAAAALDMAAWRLKASLILPGAELKEQTNFMVAEKSTFFPKNVLMDERKRYIAMRNDTNIDQVWVYDMDRDDFEPLKPGMTRSVFSSGPIEKKGSQQLGILYDPVAFPDSLHFKSISNYIDKTHFNEEGRRPPEYSAFYDRFGLGDFIDSQNGEYKTALLDILDRLNRETNSSPLFRAYIAMKLFEIMEIRPLEWGYTFCPAAKADGNRLVELGADRIHSGNWYVHSLIQRESENFEKYFESVRHVSYMKQARFYQTLARRLDSAELSFAGYVHPEQGLIRTLKAKSSPLWGFGPNGNFIALYKLNPQTAEYDKKDTPLPFSPVFCLSRDYGVDVQQACRAAGLEKTDASIAACPLIAE